MTNKEKILKELKELCVGITELLDTYEDCIDDCERKSSAWDDDMESIEKWVFNQIDLVETLVKEE